MAAFSHLRPFAGLPVMTVLILGGCVTRPGSALVRPPNLPAPNAPVSRPRAESARGVVVSSQEVEVARPAGAPSAARVLGAVNNASRVAQEIRRAATAPGPARMDEVTIRLDSGEEVIVVQPRDGLRLQPGEKVRVVTTSNESTRTSSTRVIRTE